jgi:CRP-like cAMP-binding protein
LAYGIIWLVAALYWGTRPGGTMPWAIEFWRRNGLHVAAGIALPLAAAALAYLAWELARLTGRRARSRGNRLRLWYRRWFSGANVSLDEESRVRLLSSSPVFGALEPEERQQLAQIMSARRHRVWASLPDYGNSPTHVALIVSGRVSVRREMPSGRTVHVQVLAEGDIMGLHDLSDPKFPEYRFRAATPLIVLYIQRDVVLGHIQRKVPPATLADVILKTPFLRRIALCRNWHRQAIDRFARLTQIATYQKGSTILREGQTVEMFFIIFQGDAKVSRRSKGVGTIRSGEFFGEIGLMQNSGPNASVTAHNNTRCLGIPRTDLLRFVTHNYTVALELERVSSERLGRPIFPLRKGDFRSI